MWKTLFVGDNISVALEIVQLQTYIWFSVYSVIGKNFEITEQKNNLTILRKPSEKYLWQSPVIRKLLEKNCRIDHSLQLP